jgi:hypothetical protein
MDAASASLRQAILEELRLQGFLLADDRVSPPDPASKAAIRDLYARSRQENLEALRPRLAAKQPRLLSHFADGSDVQPSQIEPIIQVVQTQDDVDLFRYATLLWSVPVSAGYGRRLRFLVTDGSNGKLIGIFALCDPVYNLRARDEWVGWGVAERNLRLYHVLDGFVIGAVPPYSSLLCGKLVAMLAASDEVRNVFRSRYHRKESVLARARRPGDLVLLTATSALGRSSLYNRIWFDGRLLYQRVGHTEGWGHFHLANGTFEAMKRFLRERQDRIVTEYRYGGGPNWRMRVVKRCLSLVGLSPGFLRHGIQREVYVVPLAQNAREYLRGDHKRPRYFGMPATELFKYFRERWLLPRASREPSYRDFKRDTIAIY